MKLRLLDDSIRLRLSRSEVFAARDDGTVEGHTHFPDGTMLVFALQATVDDTKTASFGKERMVIGLPAAELTAWADDDSAVSVAAELPLPGGTMLKVLVEKDFQCVTPRGDEDQSDLFPHPESSC